MSEQVKQVHLNTGVHSFGNATTLNAKVGKVEMEISEHGIICKHLELKRRVLVPYSNIKAIELNFETPKHEDNKPEIKHLAKK